MAPPRNQPGVHATRDLSSDQPAKAPYMSQVAMAWVLSRPLA
jgi:hypothetical protein